MLSRLDQRSRPGRPRLTGRTSAGAAAAVGSPTDVAGLAFWLDAADAATITDAGAGKVSQWSDKSGNARHLTSPNSTSRPVTGTRTVNDLNAIDFNGSSQYMIRSAFLYALGACTVFAVWQMDTDPTQDERTLFCETLPSWWDQVYGIPMAATTTTWWLYAVGTRFSVVGADPTLDTPHLLVATDSGTEAGIAVDLQTPVTAAYTRTSFGGTSFDMGRLNVLGGSFGRYWDGLVCEMIAYNSVLGAEDRALVEGYLASKWAL